MGFEMLRFFSSIVCFLFLATFGHASIFVIANMTDQAVEFDIRSGTTLTPVQLPAGASKSFAWVRGCQVVVKNMEPFAVEAWTPYVFIKTKGILKFTGIELSGKPIADNGPMALKKPITIKVKLFVDDANPFTEKVWKEKLGQRFETARKAISDSLPVSFEVMSYGVWKSDPDAKSIEDIRSDFESKEKPEPGVLKIGFTSRLRIGPNETAPVSLMKTMPPFCSHIVIREGLPKAESERAEFLTHELGHFLGAVNSPDPVSVMRAKLGDGQALRSSYRMQFDPLNLLAMSLWLSEMSDTKWKNGSELTPTTVNRLARIYDTLAKADPNERFADSISALVASRNVVEPNVVAAAPMGNAPKTAVPSNTREQAIRRVLKGMTIRAADNAAKPLAEQLTKDQLTVTLIKTAADLALSEEDAMQVPAFAVAVGLGLDDSTILRSNPLTKALCEAVESNEDFAARSKTITGATLRGRRDLCQHFAVSVALADLVGSELARQAGLAKELKDMAGASGFSFCDLAVDYAGVELVDRLKADKLLLSRIRQNFEVDRFVPEIKDLQEGLTAAQFQATYGSVNDSRFRVESAKLRERVKKLEAYVK